MIERLLTALLDDALRRLPHEPNLHDKRALAHQAHDDARSLEDLGGPRREGAAPDKRALIAQAEDRLRRLDPVGDEQEYAALTLLLRRQERHLLDLPPERLIIFEPTTFPARDPHVEEGVGGPGPHADLNAALIAVEAAATTALETPFETTLRLTAFMAERADATAALEREVAWGSRPVDLSGYERLLALPVDDRVEELLREGGGSDEDPGR